MNRRVFVLVHVGRPAAVKVAVEFITRMTDEGIGVRTVGPHVDLLAEAGAGELEGVPHANGATEGCELAVVFGGDGSILQAAELCRGTTTPLLGVNLGHVGFLAEADADDMEHVVGRVIDRDYEVEERTTVDVVVSVGGEVIARDWALNEAAVEKAARERMLEVILDVDGRPLSRWGCDGVVCATPTGSTAYNFSAGGPVVWPEVSALLVVPISAHALFARPMVVSPRSTMAIEIIADYASYGVLSCDGRRSLDLPPGALVEITEGAEVVRLARLQADSFTDRLVRKFDLPVAGWRGNARLDEG